MANAVKPAKPVVRATKAAMPVLSENPSPLEVMMATMLWHLESGRYKEAALIARDIAPYKHAKLGPVDTSGGRPLPLSLKSLSDEQLDRFIERLQAGIAAGIFEGGSALKEPDDKPKLQ